MSESFGSRVKRAWNVFMDKTQPYANYGGYGFSVRPDRVRLTGGGEKTIVNSIISRIALDAAAIDIRHVQLDDEGRYQDTIDSGLNNCLSVEANVDQTGRALIQDLVQSMLNEGCVAVVPVDTDVDPEAGTYQIESLRVGKIIDWYPSAIRVELYNDRIGRKECVVVPKANTAIIENPLYSVMNEHNSTMQRLIRKLSLLDAVDEQSSSGKLDLIIQLPYVIKTEARRKQADERRAEIERQLSGSKYGIAYADGTERITQLNRSVENNLMGQIEYLTNMLFSQIGITQGVLDGTANEETMINYMSRIIDVILTTITEEFRRKFLTESMLSQNESVEFFQDPLKLIPVSQLAELVDKFKRNEVLTSNEFRQKIGMKPSSDPAADQLQNSNLSAQNRGNSQSEPIAPLVEDDTNAD